MAQIMSGKEVSAALRQRILAETKEFEAQHGCRPGLAVIIVGEDPASQVYVRNKKKGCEEVGFLSREYALPEGTSREELLALIEELNKDPEIHGILVQLPLPEHLKADEVIAAIAPEKDVDAFSPINVGRITLGDFDLAPCTPAGIMEILKYYHVDVSGKRAVVIGRSNIVGKPMGLLLLHENATVTLCHSRTRDLAAVCREADLLVAAVGKPRFVTADMVKEGAVVIDVGIHRTDCGLVGDVLFDEVEKKASFITPVPGGVGPMTITMLLKNTLTAARVAQRKDLR